MPQASSAPRKLLRVAVLLLFWPVTTWGLNSNMRRQGSNPLHIRTSDILVKPNEELAETDKAVTISSAQYRIDAVGLKADFGKKLLEFRSRVRGTVNAAS